MYTFFCILFGTLTVLYLIFFSGVYKTFFLRDSGLAGVVTAIFIGIIVGLLWPGVLIWIAIYFIIKRYLRKYRERQNL
jgi:hypothetical protein